MVRPHEKKMKIPIPTKMSKKEKDPHNHYIKLKKSVTCCWKGRMKRRIRFMYIFSMEWIMINKIQRGINPQEDLIPPGIK